MTTCRPGETRVTLFEVTAARQRPISPASATVPVAATTMATLTTMITVRGLMVRNPLFTVIEDWAAEQ